MVDAALVIAAKAHAERRREIAHRLVVAVIERPVRRIEAALLGIGFETRGRIRRRVQREEDEAATRL